MASKKISKIKKDHLTIETLDRDGIDEPNCLSVPLDTMSTFDFEMEKKLVALKLDQEKIYDIMKNCELYSSKSARLLEIKLKVTIEMAEIILEIVRSSKQKDLTKDDKNTIEKCLKDHPQEKNPPDIAFLTGLDEKLVVEYFQSKPLSETEKQSILELSNSGYSINDIMCELNLISKSNVEELIQTYSQQYHPNKEEKEYHTKLQKQQIEEIILNVGKDTKTFQVYRTVITESFEDLIERAKKLEGDPIEVFNLLLPLIFYYLKCNLSLVYITRIINQTCKLSLAIYDTFHIIYQLSDPVVRGLCIEHYSFSNPIPFYFPSIHTQVLKEGNMEFEFCSELWYSIQECNVLISFGIGRASWNPVGKSSLLDYIFETDFKRGNSQKSAFHLQSIDIQLTKNLYGEVNGNEESTKWAYIDCHRYSDPKVIQSICRKLDIAIIHVCHSDYQINHQQMNNDISKWCKNVKYIYVFIRDCKQPNITIERKGESKTHILIPKLTDKDPSIYREFKLIGYEILHLKVEKLIGTEFVESVMSELKCPSLDEVREDKSLIQRIMKPCKTDTNAALGINFSTLSNYYPIFVEYMECYYQTSCETDQKKIDLLNQQRVNLQKELDNMKMGDIVLNFNAILERKNSGLILWQLSQELCTLTNQVLHLNKEVSNGRYSVEILWREALLTTKYGEKLKFQKNRERFKDKYASNFGSHVERGEPFELIDGDNLRFFNKDLNNLLAQFYKKQFDELSILNSNKTLCLRQAPIVISIIGPQSSGKSTLLNYCFGCKFLTSAGRCTKGIYGSLAKLSLPLNRTNQFLILDTEGLDGGGGRGNSSIHFDRTMVLFCLAVSQVVIINVIGDLGEEMQNLLQICGYSLYKLRVSKVITPKLFFVLNQQADQDPQKHVTSMNNLLRKLEASDLNELEGTKISELIQVSRDNLFVLTTAFSPKPINQPASKLFNSNVVKLAPTIVFANDCAKLRQAILNQLSNLTLDERAPFKTMNEWLEMSGVIWETIIKYQDIVKYRSVDEVRSNDLLEKIIHGLMGEHFREESRKQEFNNLITQAISQTANIDRLERLDILLSEMMSYFDEKFNQYKKQCLDDFDTKCRRCKLLNKMVDVSDEMRRNLIRIFGIERKFYEEKLKHHIKASLNEIKLADNKGVIFNQINENVDQCLHLDDENQRKEFEKIWAELFEDNERKEEEEDRIEDFNNLYTIFKLESKTMENKHLIFESFQSSNNDMSTIIKELNQEILCKFQRGSHSSSSFADIGDFIFPCKENNVPIKCMIPFAGRQDYEYFGINTLYNVTKNEGIESYSANSELPVINDWVDPECHSLVKYCSGYYNHADVTWEREEWKQVQLLASLLKDPNNSIISTWDKLLEKISIRVTELTNADPDITQGTIKLMINFFHNTFKLVNYEINYIHAKLTIAAETIITTLVFAYACSSKWEKKKREKYENTKNTEEKKQRFLEEFLEKVDRRVSAIKNWNREELRCDDKKSSRNFAIDFLDGVKRGIVANENSEIECKFNSKSDTLSYLNIQNHIEERLVKELASQPDKEILDHDHFVIQFICNRNEAIKTEFRRKWEGLADELYQDALKSIRIKFLASLQKLTQVLSKFVENLEQSRNMNKSSSSSEMDSENNFESDGEVDTDNPHLRLMKKKCILKLYVVYLQMYLDPSVTQECFRDFFIDTFTIDNIKMKNKSKRLLLDKPIDPSIILDSETFKRLTNTQIFKSEQIYNVYDYIKEFLSTINSYNFNLSRCEFEAMIEPFRVNFEAKVINCPSECPSCGKLCERELHPHSGKCRIKTGHQLCSMGGKVWKNDGDKTAILLLCDDYNDHTKVQMRNSEVTWAKFKEQTENVWDWSLPNDGEYCTFQQDNRKKMKKIWKKFGRGILNYHASRGTILRYIPYSKYKNVLKELKSAKYRICFVIDGTSSMRIDIAKARVSVKQLMQIYKKRRNPVEFRIIIYRDHCDREKIIEVFPPGTNFTGDFRQLNIF